MDKEKLECLKSEILCVSRENRPWGASLILRLINALLEEPKPVATEFGTVEAKEKCREIKKLALEILNYV